MSSQPSNKQFSLVYLFFLLTACAVVCAILRAVTGMKAFFEFRVVMAIYVIGISGYIIIRVPMIVRGIVHRRRQLVAERDKLAAWTEEKRSNPKDKG